MNSILKRVFRTGMIVCSSAVLLAGTYTNDSAPIGSDDQREKSVQSETSLHNSKTTTVKTETLTAAAVTKNGNYYHKKLPLSRMQQLYLYELSIKRKLNYVDMLAFIHHESTFRANARGGKNYGYFQINKINHARLSKVLKTKNAPNDPYVNMNWGTYMISELYTKYKKKGLKGTALKNAVLSAYNKGEGGYARTGLAKAYIKKHNQSLAYVKSKR